MAEEKTEALPGAAVAAPAAPAADSGASIAAFYDDLAEDYTSIFADWDASMRRQADVVAELLGRYFDDATAPSATPADAAAAGDAAAGSERLNVLDCACGVGTQAIGLAMRRGPLLKTRAHSPGDAEGPLTFGCVAGSDISSGAVRRAAQEARKRGVDVVEGAEEAARCAAQLQLAVADFRHLHDVWRGSGGEARQFDVVLAFDNALPHLLRFSEVSAALASMRRCVRDGGLLALSIRDYDEIVKRRPSGEPARPLPGGASEGYTFQCWQWLPAPEGEDSDAVLYKLTHVIMRRSPGGWTVAERPATYRCYQRSELTALLEGAGFVDVEWLLPTSTGYYQPIVVARAGGRA